MGRRSAGSVGWTHHLVKPTPPSAHDPVGPALDRVRTGPGNANVAHLPRSARHRHRTGADQGAGHLTTPAVEGPAVTTRLAIATLAVGQPMGQQVYESELGRRASAELGPDWKVDRIVVRTLRSPLPGRCASPPGCSSVPRRRPARRRAGHLPRPGDRPPDGPAPATGPAPEVLTVHDIVPFRFPDEGRMPSDAVTTARRAAVVICPSQFAADEVASAARRGLSRGHPQRGRRAVLRSLAAARGGARGQGHPTALRRPRRRVHGAQEPGRPGRCLAAGSDRPDRTPRWS